MSNANLVTTTVWHDRTYLVKVNAIKNYLEISVLDQQSGEEWQCNYDHLYVENLTHKTGNFKPFDTFVAMLKSGLLKTKSCVSLNLLTYQDLESLRIRRYQTVSSIQNIAAKQTNRRYLILKYNADFDRINYPLPLEYCGPPNPQFLQATIKRLECELLKTRNKLNNRDDCNNEILILQERTQNLENENYELKLQLRHSTHKSPSTRTLQTAFSQLERIVQCERKSHIKLVEQMRFDKVHLLKTIDKLKASEISLRAQLSEMHTKKKFDCENTCFGSRRTMKTLYRKSRSLSQESIKSQINKLQESTDSSILSQKGMQTRKIKKRSRRDNISTSSLCSSINHSTDRTIKNISRNSSRNSSIEPLKRYSTASQSNFNDSSCKSSEMNLCKPIKNKIRARHSSLKSVKQDKNDFTDLEKKVSSLQKLLNTKRR